MSARVVHFEIPFDDAERAQGFYRDVFGWTVNTMPELDYTIVSTGPTDDQGMPSEPGFISGGMMKRQEPLGTPVITLQVDDIDKTLTMVEENGGSTVLGKMPVAEMGFTGYFRDSEGNLMGLWQTAS
jgi:predicted enzyme related to lactoylglutathione lyase